MSKKTNWVKISVVFVMLLLMTALTIADDLPGIKWLKEVMDQHHTSYAVYKDFISAGNNFSMLGRFGTATNMTVDANYTNSVHTGLSNNLSCIKVVYVPTVAEEYVGWYYLNGASTSGTGGAVVNWGSYPDAGVNLTGSTNITFWAKGSFGVKVKFIALGVGRNHVTGAPTMPFCGSSQTVSREITFTDSAWHKYSIDLTGKDLSYVLGGFGWSIEKTAGTMGTQVFYIDQIEYNGMDRSSEPRLLTSYKSIPSNNDVDIALRNTAYTYDSCLAALAFLAVGEYERARNILDALVYVQNNDRYFTDGRIRNAYQSGNLALPNGWLVNGKAGCARMPGVWAVTNTNTGAEAWLEDRFAVSTDTGNIAWTMLAYITAYDILKDEKYLDAAKIMGDWIQTNYAVSNDLHIEYSLTTTNGGGYTTNTHVYENQRVKFEGYSGQFDGWGSTAVKHAYKSIEHNLDLYVVFQRLYDITSENKWLDRAIVASNFSMAMWENTDKKFLVGTEFKYDSAGTTNEVVDGTNVTITITHYTKEVIDQTNHSNPSDEFHEATDAQAWMILALRLQNTDYTNALHYVVNNAKYSNTWGFDYNINRALWETPGNGRVHPDAIWYEGTAQMATAFMIAGDYAIATNIVTEVINGRVPSGAQPAAGPDDAHDKVSTGFWLPEGEWFYYRREHVGATSWAIVAEKMRNMFWIGTSDEFLDPNNTFSHSSFSSTNTASSSSTSSFGSNVIPNPSFEQVSDWTTEWSPGAPWVPAGWLQCQWNYPYIKRTGEFSRFFYSVAMDNYMMIWMQLASGSRPTWSPGKAARASVWFNTPANVGHEFYIEVIFMDANGVKIESSKAYIGKDDVNAAADGWHELVVYTPHAPDGTTQLDVKIGVAKGYFYNSGFNLKVDDVSLVEYTYEKAVGNKKYVVYSEETAGNQYFVFDWSGDLQVWNNLTVGSNIATQYEGNASMVLNAASGDWFGMAINQTNGLLDLSDYVSGSLNFAVKTTSTEHFKVGIVDAQTNEMWVNFVNGDTNYGVIRDGNWHKVSIPMGHFFGITELKDVTTVFALAGEPAGSAVTIEIDDIYFSTTAKTNYPDQKARLLNPANNATLGITGVNFKWTSGINVTEYRLTLGTSAGATDIYDATFNPLYRSAMIVDLPKNGSTVYARLYSTINGSTQYYDYTFTSGNATAPYTYMIMSETSGSESFYLDTDGNVLNAWIYEWGILAGEPTVNITENTNSAYEGNACVRVTATNTNDWAWFGIGFMSEPPRDLSSFSGGTFNVALKTTSEDYFKIGIKDGANESWIHFVAVTNAGGSNHAYGFVRDGNWHLLKIPMSHFADVGNLTSVNHMFMLAGESPESEVVIDIDHMYVDIASTTPANFPAQIVTPINGSKLDITGVYFNWTHGAGVTEYSLSIGTNGSYNNVYDKSHGTDREAFVHNLPIHGETLNIRMGSKINGVWQYLDYVYKAGDVTLEYTYGIYSENTTYDQMYLLEIDGQLQDWYLCQLGTGKTTAYEGVDALSASLQPASTRAFGITASPAVNMTAFTNSLLKLAIKTTSLEPFAIGFKIGDTQYNVGFTNGNDPYGFLRDGNWQSLVIPMSDFGASNLSNMTAVFAFYGYKKSTWASAMRVDFDDIKWVRPSTNINYEPYITTTPGLIASISNEYVYDVDAIDYNLNVLTYSLLVNPTGMTINSASGLITWTPTASQTNEYDVTVKVVDGFGGEDSQSFKVNASDIQFPWRDNTNGPFKPTYLSSGYTIGYHFTPVKDGQIKKLGGMFDPGTRTVKLWNKETGELIAQVDVAGNTNEFTYSNIPAVNVYSDTEYTVSVYGGRSAWDVSPYMPQTYKDISILGGTYDSGDVRPRYLTKYYVCGVDIGFAAADNSRPVITSVPSDKAASADNLYTYDVNATDPDGDGLTYSLLEWPVGMTINTNSGLVSWTPTIYQTNEYTVTVKVDDNQGNFNTQSYTLHCFGANSYFLIEKYLPKNDPYNNYMADRTFGYHFTPVKDGTISMLGGNFEGTNRKVSIWNRDTGELLGSTNVSANNEWAYEKIAPISISAGTRYTIGVHLTTGVYYVRYTISSPYFPLTYADVVIDGYSLGIGDVRPIEITSTSQIYGVADFLFTPASNTAPVIPTEIPTLAYTNQAYSYDVDAIDPDGDSVTYSLLTNPSGLSINSSSGLLSWTPSSAQVGNHSVTIKAEDSRGASRTKTYTMNVLEYGQTVWMPNETTNSSAGSYYNYTLGYFFTPQANGVITMLGLNAKGSVNLRLWNKDSGVVLAETNVTALDGWSFVKIPPVGVTNGGRYVVAGYYSSVRGQYKYVSSTFPQTYGEIQITGGAYRSGNDIPTSSYSDKMYGRVDIVFARIANSMPPEITSTPDVVAAISNVYVYDVDAIDYNGDTLTYSLLTNPAGMTINSSTGVITWTPTSTNSENVSVKVVDGTGGEDVQNFVMLVAIPQKPWRSVENGTYAGYDGWKITGYYFTPMADGKITQVAGRYSPYGNSIYIYDTVTKKQLIDSPPYLSPGGVWTTVDITPINVLSGRRYAVMVYYRGGIYTGVTNLPATVGDIRIDGGVYQGGNMTCPSAAVNTNTMYGGIDITFLPATNSTPFITTEPVVPQYLLSDVTFTYDCDAMDADGDAITYSFLTNPTGMTINSTNGQISWTPSANEESITNNVTIKVQDIHGKYSTQSFDLAVISGQTPWRRIEHGVNSTSHGWSTKGFYFTPQKDGKITQLAGRYTMGERMYIYDTLTQAQLVQSDYINPGGTWTYVDIPDVNVIVGRRYALMVYYRADKYTGVTNIPWTIGDIRIDGGAVKSGNPGSPTTAPDTSIIYGGIDMVFIPATNSAPQISSAPVTSGWITNAYTYDVDATDPDGDSVTYSLLTNPAGMTINSTTGVISWTPTASQSNNHNVTVKVSDGHSGESTQSFVLDVRVPGNYTYETPWQDNENGSLSVNVAWNYTMGYHFTPQQNGQISALGGYFNGTKTVKLWNRTTGVLLAQTNVTSANAWTYVDITPVDVTSGTQYTVAVVLAGSGGSYRSSLIALPQTYSAVRIDSSTYYSGDGRPTNNVTTTMYGQADIKFRF